MEVEQTMNEPLGGAPTKQPSAPHSPIRFVVLIVALAAVGIIGCGGDENAADPGAVAEYCRGLAEDLEVSGPCGDFIAGEISEDELAAAFEDEGGAAAIEETIEELEGLNPDQPASADPTVTPAGGDDVAAQLSAPDLQTICDSWKHTDAETAFKTFTLITEGVDFGDAGARNAFADLIDNHC